MYSPVEIDKFLNRKLNNWEWLKKLDKGTLIQTINDLGYSIDFKTEPYVHQLVSYLLGIYNENFLYFLFVGAGKSYVALNVINHFIKNRKLSKVLLLVPYTITINSWEDEVKKHSDLTYLPLEGTTKKRWDNLSSNIDKYDIIGLSYPGLIAMVSGIKPVRIKKRIKNKRVIDDYLLDKFVNYFDAVIYDECFYKNSLVNTPFGLIPIKGIKRGDIVYNLTGKAKVKQKFVTKVKLENVVKIVLSNKKTIFCSKNHIFFTKRGEVEAEDLKNEVIYSLPYDITEPKNTRQEKRGKVKRVRVESVEVYKPGYNDESFSSVITNTELHQGYVEFYDLEIEGHPSYNIENIPVHNCHMIKGYNTLTFDICKEISNKCKYRYGLTGTPTSRDLQDFWTQFYLIDKGETLGKTISFYRQAFFDIKQNYWGGFEYKIQKKLKPKLFEFLNNKSISYDISEAYDLPEKLEIKKLLSVSQQQHDFYKKAIQGVIEAKGSIKLLDNAYIKLRQICSGFVSFITDDKEKVEIVFDENPKLEAIIEILEEVGDEKVIIFNEYTISGDIIASKLKEHGIKYERLYGATENKYETMQRFLNDTECKVYIVNVKSGSMSLNLQKCHYLICYETPTSPIDRQQMIGRVYRTGQKNNVFIYDLVMRHTIEEKIQEYIKEGKDLYNELFNRPNILLEKEYVK